MRKGAPQSPGREIGEKASQLSEEAREARASLERALPELYAKHWDELVRFLTRTFGSGQYDPEDAAQAAFLHYAALVRPQDIDNPRAFLFRSARNHVVDQKRRMKVHKRFAGGADAERLGTNADELDAERVLSSKERLRLLERAINSLPDPQREAFILNRVHELSYAEIARRQRYSQTQAKRLVAAALAAVGRAFRQAELGDD